MWQALFWWRHSPIPLKQFLFIIFCRYRWRHSNVSHTEVTSHFNKVSSFCIFSPLCKCLSPRYCLTLLESRCEPWSLPPCSLGLPPCYISAFSLLAFWLISLWENIRFGQCVQPGFLVSSVTMWRYCDHPQSYSFIFSVPMHFWDIRGVDSRFHVLSLEEAGFPSHWMSLRPQSIVVLSESHTLCVRSNVSNFP